MPVADLPSHVVPDDVPAVRGFREALLHGRMESAAAFRVVRADDGSVRQIRAYAELIGRGVKVDHEPRDEFWGRYFSLTDPDGNHWLVVQSRSDS